MIKESLFYKLICKIGYFLKHSRIYEIVSNLFYISRFSFLFCLIEKKPEIDILHHSIFKNMVDKVLKWFIRLFHYPLQKINWIIEKSFLLNLAIFQKNIFKRHFLSVTIFYSFVFYTGYCLGLVIKNNLTMHRLFLLFVLAVLNLLNLNWNLEKYLNNSLFVNIIKKIFA